MQTSLNEGALFGFGQGKVFLFAALSVVAAVGIPIWLFYAGAATDWLLCIALACVTAGIFGNLYDRLAMHGLTWHVPPKVGEPVHAVRDFVLLQLNNKRRWPNFNVADSLLVCGAALLLWHALHPPTARSQDDVPVGNSDDSSADTASSCRDSLHFSTARPNESPVVNHRLGPLRGAAARRPCSRRHAVLFEGPQRSEAVWVGPDCDGRWSHRDPRRLAARHATSNRRPGPYRSAPQIVRHWDEFPADQSDKTPGLTCFELDSRGISTRSRR